LQEVRIRPKVLIMTKKFAEVSRDPICTLEQAGFSVEEKNYDRIVPAQKEEICRVIPLHSAGWRL